MTQQINLLNPDLRPKRELFSALNLLLSALLALALVAGTSALGFHQENNAARRLADIQTRTRQIQDQITALAQEQSGKQKSPALQDQIRQTQALIKGKETALAALHNGAAGVRGHGFYTYMAGLARQMPPGIWLTGFDIQAIHAGGKTMQIHGRMQHESMLPALIQRLNQEPAFEGQRFEALNLNRVEPPPAQPAGAGATAPTPVATTYTASPYVEFALIGQVTPEIKSSGEPKPK